MTPQAVKVRSDVEVACYGYEGIDAVKAALKEGLKFSTEEMPVKVIKVPSVLSNWLTSRSCISVYRLEMYSVIATAVWSYIEEEDNIVSLGSILTSVLNTKK